MVEQSTEQEGTSQPMMLQAVRSCGGFTLCQEIRRNHSNPKPWKMLQKHQPANGGNMARRAAADAMAYDPELKLLYIGTGNGSPWNREITEVLRGGDNLYLCSIVALNPDNGELVVLSEQHREIPGTTQLHNILLLADLQIDGVTRKVFMQAPKNRFYVLDRTNGKLNFSLSHMSDVNWASGIN